MAWMNKNDGSRKQVSKYAEALLAHYSQMLVRLSQGPPERFRGKNEEIGTGRSRCQSMPRPCSPITVRCSSDCHKGRPNGFEERMKRSEREEADAKSQGPPERFRGKNEEIVTDLLLLLRPEYPMVLNDDDLLEMNLHLDERDGQVTGIVDWADAIVSPFGMSLRRLETILGVQTSSCWHFHANHGFLRAQF
ncbi:hypothetical protein DCS_03235 [Drechmeria coniospora]|uniref:Aminoglycoside phosphotransferase domain-containing protein n=1 Tax=Drechmeria coniospora TaxID=98403 RepID=A0A151GYC4_DRECN|nr:hypothetical protein DCS_03235 [Drechmeria coniospora]KYK62090.1 hypothetical protein DCS_03235 [Drechmeria coniospora]